VRAEVRRVGLEGVVGVVRGITPAAHGEERMTPGRERAGISGAVFENGMVE
jgi:hypothetical protein